MKFAKVRVSLVMTGMLVLLLACNTPTNTSPDATEPASNDGTILVDVEATESAPAAEVPPSIQHTDIPVNLPDNQSGKAADFDSSKILENKTPIGGDRFTFGRFERPFNANAMDVYFSQIDIIDTMVFQDDTWIYASITMNDLQQSSTESVKYAVELDVDLNGKGDWLIIAGKPSSTDWAVSSVQVYKDANKDVGGEMPMLTDKTKLENDGFETLTFDQGQGDDPDTAWVRISPNDPNTIQFAIKKSALENPTQYLINMWAGTKLLDPGKFDLNDQFSHEQAGAADSGLDIFYPIKEVAEIDNSCRMAVGFQPTGTEPGLCESVITQQINEPGAPGAPPPPGMTCGVNQYLSCVDGVCFCQDYLR
ncbi:MAG: hypothetical protein Fur0017_27870 [Anaerolineales bacterium]